MIKINSAMMQNEIVELLIGYEENELEFSFFKKDGDNLYFETNASDLEEAAAIAKSLIGKQTWGSLLLFEASPA